MPTLVQSAADLDPNQSYTYADYRSWPFEGWEEIIRGRLRPVPGYGEPHQRVVGELLLLLSQHVKRRSERCYTRLSVALTGSGQVSSPVEILSVVVPDLCVISDLTRLDGQGYVGAPDWIIEVLSPGSFTRDTRDKFDLYAEAGVGEYWIVAPGEQNIAAYVLDAATSRYGLVAEYSEPGRVPCHTLPDFVLEWADVFPPRP